MTVDPDDGTLSSSQVRWGFLETGFKIVFFAALPLTFITWLLAVIGGRTDFIPLPVVIGSAAVVGVLWLVSIPLWIVVDRHRAKNERVKAEIHAVRDAREWEYRIRVEEWERGWTLAPLSRVANVVVSPCAVGVHAGITFGVGYLEGDLTLGGTEVRAFQTRIAVADVGVQLPAVTFLVEDFRERLAAAVTGDDLDVESDEFNRHWRVKTADPLGAHGLLTPRLIELLIDERSKGLAIQCDGTRVVIWDDAREGTADAEDRLELLQGFVERLPGFAKRRQA